MPVSRDAKGKKAHTTPTAAKPLSWFGRLLGLRSRLKPPAGALPLLKDAVNDKAARRGDAPAGDDALHLSRALKGMLDRHAASRSVLVHLGLVEQAMERKGLKGLEELPPDVLRRAVSQLETLVTDWSEGSLAALRARLRKALAEPASAQTRRAGPGPKKASFDDSRLQVEEASVTTFMEARAQWERSATGGR